MHPETKILSEEIVHDGTFQSCDDLKQWARARGFDLISSVGSCDNPFSFVARIGRNENIISLRPGEKAYFLGGRVKKCSVLLSLVEAARSGDEASF